MVLVLTDFCFLGSKKVGLPLHIAARIRLGEEVSAEEITEALQLEQERRDREERDAREEEERKKKGIKSMKIPEGVDRDFLPPGATVVGGSGGARRRKK